MPFKDFFNEQTSASNVRLMTFMALCVALILALMNGYIAILSTFNSTDVSGVMSSVNWIIGILLGFAGGSKVWQKFAENKEKKEEELK